MVSGVVHKSWAVVTCQQSLLCREHIKYLFITEDLDQSASTWAKHVENPITADIIECVHTQYHNVADSALHNWWHWTHIWSFQ